MQDGLNVAGEEPVRLQRQEHRDLGHVMGIIVSDNETSMRQF